MGSDRKIRASAPHVRLGELAKKMGGHGGMDFLMQHRIIRYLRIGEALDQNVSMSAFYRLAVGPLGENRLRRMATPQIVPRLYAR